MEVIHSESHVTHAVLGGQKAIQFAVADTSDMMAVLSAGLYSHPKLAVIRETICNQWDAHLDAGKADTPIEITLNQEEMIFRDFGKGIPARLIGPIYGTYGASTKTHDGNQTGGFGLGCKSPFAYADHFEVTSWSVEDGGKMVYDLSKSAAEVKGKPGIVPLFPNPIPTKETGLQVRIKLKNPSDETEFGGLIKDVVLKAGIPCKLNGEMLRTLNHSKMVNGYAVFPRGTLGQHHVNVLYGQVIYPIELHPDIRSNFNKIVEYLKSLGGYSIFPQILFKAQPHSISITPSREMLNMSSVTCATINKLIEDFLKQTEDPTLESKFLEMVDKRIAAIVSEKDIEYHRLFSIHKTVVGNDVVNKRAAYTPEQLTDLYLVHHYPRGEKLYHEDVAKRFEALKKTGVYSSSLLDAWLVYFKNSTKPVASFLKENIFDDLTKKLIADPVLDPGKLVLWSRYASNRNHYDSAPLGTIGTFVANRSTGQYDTMTAKDFCRKLLILAFNRQDAYDRVDGFPEVQQHGDIMNSFVYITPRSPAKVDAAKAFFKKEGFIILDMTVRQPWEDEDVLIPISVRSATVATPAKPKRKGLIRLDQLLVKESGVEQIKLVQDFNDTTPTIDKPAFIIKLNLRTEQGTLPDLEPDTARWFIKNHGTKGGIVFNSAQEEKYIREGAKPFYKYLAEIVEKEVVGNPRITESLPFKIPQDGRGYSHYDAAPYRVLDVAAMLPDLAEYLGLVQTMNQEDKHNYRLWKYLWSEHSRELDVKDLQTKVPSTKTDKLVTDLLTKIKTSMACTILDTNRLFTVYVGIKNRPKELALFQDTILNLIEG